MLLQEGGAFRALFGAVTAEASTVSSAAAEGSKVFLPAIILQDASSMPLDPPSKAQPVLFGPVNDGVITYYAADGSGNCGFPATPDNLMVAALNTIDYDTAALCGSYIKVVGPKGEVIVRVVDRCPGCSDNHVDLSPAAFEKVADLSLGRVDVQWQQVSPPIETPIIYQFKDSSNPWWMAVQIRNIRTPVAKFEYLDESGSFVEVERVMWNYFVIYGGLGVGPYTFRVTDVFGRTITDENVPLLDNAEYSSQQQFLPPPEPPALTQ